MSESLFSYTVTESELEKASNGYVMSLIAVMIGLPLPIINLLATFVFYLGNRKGTHFVRWHCTQALLSQFSLFIFNTVGFWWSMSILFKDTVDISNNYIAYIATVLLLNAVELAITIYTAIKTRKGEHVSWWFYGPLTNLICKS